MGFKIKALALIAEQTKQIQNLGKEILADKKIIFELHKKYGIIKEEQTKLEEKIKEIEDRGASVTEISQKMIDDAKKLNSVQKSIEAVSNEESHESVDVDIFGGSL